MMMVGVNSSMLHLIYCKNIYKCHNVLPPSTTIKKKKKKEGSEGREGKEGGRKEGRKTQ
jgi:hypothetical protein